MVQPHPAPESGGARPGRRWQLDQRSVPPGTATRSPRLRLGRQLVEPHGGDRPGFGDSGSGGHVDGQTLPPSPWLMARRPSNAGRRRCRSVGHPVHRFGGKHVQLHDARPGVKAAGPRRWTTASRPSSTARARAGNRCGSSPRSVRSVCAPRTRSSVMGVTAEVCRDGSGPVLPRVVRWTLLRAGLVINRWPRRPARCWLRGRIVRYGGEFA